MFFEISIAITVGLAIYIFRLVQRHRQYWSERGIKTPAMNLLFGNLLSIVDEHYPRPLKFREWTEELGKVPYYGIQEGWQNALVISDPEMLHEVFVKKFEHFYARKLFILIGDVDKLANVHVFQARGARWKRLRVISNPTFTVNNLKKIMPIIDDTVKHLIGLFDKFAESGKAFDISKYYQELTMDVIARIAMGQHDSTLFASPYLDIVKRIFNRPASNAFVLLSTSMPFLAPAIGVIARFMSLSVFKDSNHLTSTIYRAVEERRRQRASGKHQTQDDRIDFIDLFLDAEAQEDFLNDGQFEKQGLKVERKLTADEIVAQLFVFLLAGFDTTANSLSYLSYCFAKNPEAMHLAQQEIDDVCTEEKITYEQVMDLKYLDMAAKESLRMYPLAAQANSRICMETTKLGDVLVEKGVHVLADTMSLHYDKAVWGEDADEFHPERWESADRQTALSWIPFGAGPRTCIGMRLALIEEKLTMARLLRDYDIIACSETEEKLVLRGAGTISPESVTIKLQRRTTN